MVNLSLIIPCYNEQETIPLFYEETIKVLSGLSIEYEMLFIDDGSKDKTLDVVKSIAGKDKCVKYFSFSRNFGKEAAMYAGFLHAKGEYIAVLDADMQDPPSLLPQMLSILKNEGYDSVATRRENRKGEPPIRSFFAKKFYKLINAISDADIVDGARDFRLMRYEMVDAIVSMNEYNRFSKGIFGWIGFKTYWLSYENVERVAGATKWDFWKLLKYALNGIISFSEAPLDIASWFGMFMTFLSFVSVIFVVLRRLIFGDPVAGWASLVCVIIFMGGIQLLCIGILGKYLAKTYTESKHRPHYILSETNDEGAKKIG